MKKVRILHISAGGQFGGIEKVLYTLAQTQEYSSRIVQSFALEAGHCAELIKSTRSEVYILSNSISSFTEELTTILKASDYDVVICHKEILLPLINKIVQRFKIPVVFYCHGDLTGINENLIQMIKPDFIIYNSQFMFNKYCSLSQNIPHQVIYCPLIFARIPSLENQNSIRFSLRKELELPQDAFVFLQATRLASFKGHEIMLDALSRLLKSNPEQQFYYIICGEAYSLEQKNFVDYLKKKSEASGLSSRIRWLGYKKSIDDFLIAADAVCQPNFGLQEPFGLFFVESLYYGKPVLTSASGGAIEIFKDGLGYLLPEGDAMALAKVILELFQEELKNPALPLLRRKRAEALCDPKVTYKALEDVMNKVLSKK